MAVQSSFLVIQLIYSASDTAIFPTLPSQLQNAADARPLPTHALSSPSRQQGKKTKKAGDNLTGEETSHNPPLASSNDSSIQTHQELPTTVFRLTLLLLV